MADIIIAFPKLDDAKNLRKLLVRNGYDVNMVCDSGAPVSYTHLTLPTTPYV